MYPSSKLIMDFMAERHLTKTEFVKCLGYKKINRGLRRLQRCLDTGVISDYIQTMLVTRAGMDRERLQKALRETQMEMERERKDYMIRRELQERLQFRPHLYALSTATRPSFITGYAICGGENLRIIPLPENILNVTSEERMVIIKNRIEDYKKKYKSSIPFFGPLSGFIYQYTYDEGMELSVEGEILHIRTKKGRKGESYWEIGNKRIESSIDVADES